MFLEGVEYLSIWEVAHRWSGHNPNSTDPEVLPQEVKDLIQRIIIGHFRNDLPLRKGKGRFCINAENNGLLVEIFVALPLVLKLRKSLTKNVFDKNLLSSHHIQRGETLRWCQKEFLAPPPFWTPENSLTPQKSIEIDDSDDDKENWYNTMSDVRKRRVTCLEIAKQLWKENPELSYEQVRSHPTMTRYGYGAKFTLGVFKKWARPFASEFAKKGGNKS